MGRAVPRGRRGRPRRSFLAAASLAVSDPTEIAATISGCAQRRTCAQICLVTCVSVSTVFRILRRGLGLNRLKALEPAESRSSLRAPRISRRASSISGLTCSATVFHWSSHHRTPKWRSSTAGLGYRLGVRSCLYRRSPPQRCLQSGHEGREKSAGRPRLKAAVAYYASPSA